MTVCRPARTRRGSKTDGKRRADKRVGTAFSDLQKGNEKTAEQAYARARDLSEAMKPAGYAAAPAVTPSLFFAEQLTLRITPM